MLERWRERDVFHESIRRREGAKPFLFYEGPPTANGLPGLAPRPGARLQGRVPALPDDARPLRPAQGGLGLPRPAGRARGGEGARLPQQARHRALRGRRVQRASAASRCSATSTSGTSSPSGSASGSTPTTPTTRSTNEYVESVWWSLKQVWEKGLLIEGNRVVPYCTRCGTALSSHELALGYKDVVDPSVFVKFPLVDEPGRLAARVDDDAVDARPARGDRRRPGGHLRARPPRRRQLILAEAARRARARRGGGDRGAHAGLGAARAALRAALPLHHRLRRARPHRPGRRLRLDRGRHRRGPHRRGVRRGRLPARHRERPDDPQPGAAGRHLRRAHRPVLGDARA